MYSGRDSFKDGETFEKFVEEVIFPASHFILLEKTHNYQQNSSRYVWSSLKPDFKFKSIASGRIFSVEVKFRSRYNEEGKLDLLTHKQYQRYNSLDSPKHPVFLLVGTEGYPNNPKLISLIHIKEIRPAEIFRTFVYNHRIPATICPEYALTSNIQTHPDYVTPNLKDIASGLTYSTRQTKRTNYLAWTLGFLVLAVFTVFFITESVIAEDKIVHSVTIRDKVKEYYSTLELNNTEALDYYLNDHLDRWYSKTNVSLSSVKKNADAYNKRYPIRHIDVNWSTFEERTLPNGDYNVSYNVNYRMKPAKSNEFQFYRLGMKAIWNKEMKIKSMYEVNLDK